MKHKKIMGYCGLWLSIAACTNQESIKPPPVPASASEPAVPSDSLIWHRYRQDVLHLPVDTGKHTYVLVSQYGCAGCQSYLANMAVQEERPHITYVFPKSFGKRYYAEVAVPASVHFDSSGRINKLKFHGGNASILRTRGNVIVSNTLVNSSDLASTVID
jgi:hypothetical protein